MSTSKSTHEPINITEGVEPDTDNTPFSTNHFVMCDKVRFVGGRPRKIKGWQAYTFDNSATISGVCRSIFSTMLSDRIYTTLGTNQKLYSLVGTGLVNITPLRTATVAIGNSISTHFATLANNPITTVNGSPTVTIADTEAAKFVAGDSYKISGSAAVNGIPAASLNKTHTIRAVGASTITVMTDTNATSSGAGGGAAVVRTSGLLTFAAAAHGQANGDRTKILGAADTGGILAAAINLEFVIRNVAAGTFDVMTASVATSSVAAGGGGATTYQIEIADGAADESNGIGYGMGLYGAGLYGTAKIATTARILPRMYSSDRFGNVMVMTPGNQTGLYKWDGGTNVAPTLVTNAPTQINYCFVSDNVCVTFGAGGVENRIQTSDQGALTVWAGTPENQVYEDDLEGAGRLMSHVNVNGVNLVFTENQVYTMTKIDISLGVWSILPLDKNIGLIAQNARICINGIAYWMGQDNFYMWQGGNVQIIPSNSGEMSTIINYVFDNLNSSQKSKIYVEYIERFTELRFHYPSQGSNECDRVACVNIMTSAWWPDTISRSAAEYPNALQGAPRLIGSTGILYNHETGNDDNGSPLPFSFKTGLRYSGKPTLEIAGLIPDSVQTGAITATLNTFLYPQSAQPISTKVMDVAPTTETIPCDEVGRFWDWEIDGDELDQSFIMGDWMDEIQPSSPQ